LPAAADDRGWRIAVEELLRWTTPLHHFRRTATRDVQLGRSRIAAGAKVVVWYTSANRDENVFQDPYRLDLRRSPNPHTTFGRGGPHRCLGEHLARLELRVLLQELLPALPRLKLVVTPLSPPPEAEDNLRDIRSITDAALSYLGADEFLTALLSRVKKSLGADTAAVLLLGRSARQLIATAASGLEEEVRQGVRLPVGQGFAGRIAAEAQPIILDHVDHGNVLNPILLEKGIRSLIGVPLLVNGAVIGVLHVGSVGSRVFTGDDTALLQMAADRAALAVQSLRSREDRAAATALQQSLLPPELPAVPGVQIAARYVPGDGRVSGDWYDVFTLPSGELCLVMGDVAGSGLEAAVPAWPTSRSACRSASPMTRAGRPPPCRWRPARCCASSPTGWSNAGTRPSMTASPASARPSRQSRRKGSVPR
jgi:putative methionine-R-sulfoxide reductase with GAF domain